MILTLTLNLIILEWTEIHVFCGNETHFKRTLSHSSSLWLTSRSINGAGVGLKMHSLLSRRQLTQALAWVIKSDNLSQQPLTPGGFTGNDGQLGLPSLQQHESQQGHAEQEERPQGGGGQQPEEETQTAHHHFPPHTHTHKHTNVIGVQKTSELD